MPYGVYTSTKTLIGTYDMFNKNKKTPIMKTSLANRQNIKDLLIKQDVNLT